MPLPPLDWDRIQNRVADFNASGAPYYLAETALHEAFKHGLTAETVPLCIMAVNSFWNANVDKEPGALRHACESTVAALPEILPIFASVQERVLPLGNGALDLLIEMGCALLPRFLKSADGKRTNYSFATKFLHWCCPSSLPIVDNMSVKTMNRIVGSKSIWVPGPGSTTTQDLCRGSYGRVIRFYNEALAQLTPTERDALVAHDLQTQPRGFQRRNTVVRIFDKYLWMEVKQPKPSE
jgi:hypothetical protein